MELSEYIISISVEKYDEITAENSYTARLGNLQHLHQFHFHLRHEFFLTHDIAKKTKAENKSS